MALTLTVCQLRAGGASFRKETSSVFERIIKTHTTTWEVIASGITDPSDVDEVMAGSAAGLPSIGNSVYIDKETGQIFPYFFCDSKQVERDSTNAFRFEVTVGYKDELGDDDPQDRPDNAEDLCPVVTFSSGEKQQTAWNGTNTTPNGQGGAILLPTGEFYEQAVTRRSGELIVNHTQYENTFNEATFRARIFHVNSGSYRGYGAGHAMITGITWQKALIPINPNTTMSSNKVSYTISCVNTVTKTLNDQGQPDPLEVGHHHLRIRQSHDYLAEANNPASKIAYNTTFPNAIGKCFLKTTGEKHDKDNQMPKASVAPLDKWLVQPKVSFGFLRECP